ncbi:MAG: hypothetical protein ACYTG2_14500 [Planctomycetota bacterium]|jgi:hypothetical protein
MRVVLSALAGAFLSTVLHWKLVLVAWVLGATVAWVMASPYASAIDATVLRNPAAPALLSQFDNEAWIDFQNVQADALAAGRTTARAVALPWIVLWTLLSVGMVARLADGRRHPRLLPAIATYGHRALWLLVITAVPVAGLWWLNDVLSRTITSTLVDGMDRGAGAATLGWSMTLKTLGMLLALGLVLAVGRIARLRMIQCDEHFVPLTWLRAAWSLLRRVHLVAPAMLLAMLPALGVIALYELLGSGLLAGIVSDDTVPFWRYAFLAVSAQVLFQAALVYRLAVDVGLWPLLAPARPAPPPEPPAPTQPERYLVPVARTAPTEAEGGPPADEGPEEPPPPTPEWPAEAPRHRPSSGSGGDRIITALLIGLGGLCATTHAQASGEEDALSIQRNQYVIEVTLDAEDQSVSATQIATFLNPTRQTVTELWMHLYPAAFGNTHSTWMREGGPEPITRRGQEGSGTIEILAVTSLTGQDIGASVEIDDTLMRIDLDEPVPPGGQASVGIEFVTRFPRTIARMGGTGPHLDGMQWYPKFCAHGEDGWITNQFHRTGEFFANFGSYDVTFNLPPDLPFEATGVPTVISEAPDLKVVRYTARDVHDFAFCADPNFVRVERRFTYTAPEMREVQVIYLCQPYALPKADQVLDTVESCLRDAGEWWMPYPYPRLVIDGLPHDLGGGMEYPMLFTISQRSPNHMGWLVELLEDPAGVTAHEFGHQYWYGILASNEFDEAWLDEGLNTWGTVRLLESRFPDAGRTDAITFLERDLLRALFNGAWQGRLPFSGHNLSLQEVVGWRTSPFHDSPPDKPASSPTLLGWRVPGLGALRLPDMSANRMAWQKDRYYEDARVLPLSAPSREFSRGYGSLVYSKSALVLETLQNHVGETTMREIMRTYVERNRFEHPTREDFLGVVSELTGGAHDELMRQLVETTATVDYSVEQVSSRQDPGPTGFTQQARPGDPTAWSEPSPLGEASAPWVSRFVVRQLGELEAPVTIEARFEDGSTQRSTWDGTGGSARFQHETPSKLAAVVVDPDRRFAIDLDVHNNSWCAEPSEQTARLLKSFTHFWSQNVLNGWSLLF